jgi:hypothetical protein
LVHDLDHDEEVGAQAVHQGALESD